MFKNVVIKLRRSGGGVFFRKILVGTILISVLVPGCFDVVRAENTGSGSQNFLNLEPNSDLLNVSREIDKALKDTLEGIGLQNLINVNTNIPTALPSLNILNLGSKTIQEPLEIKKFLTTEGISSNDILGVLIGALSLAIRIFIVVVQIVSDILKGVLEALNTGIQ